MSLHNRYNLLKATFRVFWLLTPILLTACVSPPQIGLPDDNLDTWTAKGKLGLRHNNKAQSINFSWANDKDAFDIRMYGNLGLGSIRVNNVGDYTTLETSDGVRRADSPENLLYEATGFRVPVRALRHWIVGRASPLSPIDSVSKDDEGRITKLAQEGWHIEYARFHDDNESLLPRKILVSQNNILLTIVVKSWR